MNTYQQLKKKANNGFLLFTENDWNESDGAEAGVVFKQGAL
ncbi:hypothetical protein [Pseudoalteromonas sp. DL2-H2.2]|nr:hypothetical protein [Pseudoalteromonas sp. DL2-H2.2]